MPVFASETSKIKMVILTKTNFSNAVWYSPIKQNKMPENRIIDGMIRRLQKHNLFAVTNVVHFYEQETNQLIAKWNR